MKKIFLLLSLGTFFGCNQEKETSRVIMDIPGFPLIFELNVGESFIFNRNGVQKRIELLSFQSFEENNLWIPDSLNNKNYYKAEITLIIDSDTVNLLHRAYELPKTIDDVKILVEGMREWDKNNQVVHINEFEKDVRFSMNLADSPWCTTEFEYPIEDFSFKASSYNNTWSALVPYNHLYYHLGEDRAAIPDKLIVVAPLGGEVVESAYPDGDGKSNAVMVKTPYGIVYRFAHMNSENIYKTSALGNIVNTGDTLGLTGETWNGYKSQHTGPHLHFELRYNDSRLNPYPFYIESYLRKYPDKVLAVAGGYRFAKVGEKIELDASRTVIREGEKIKSLYWITHDGDTIHNQFHEIIYTEPGLYSEELRVVTESGFEDRDFLQVRIFDPKADARKIVCRHVHFWPVRNININDTILFWNRLQNNVTPVYINFNDGSEPEKIKEELKHVYKSPGIYSVVFNTTGQQGEKAEIKLEVKVGY